MLALDLGDDRDPAQPLAARIARPAQRAVPGAFVAGAAAVVRVESYGVTVRLERAFAAPAVAGGAAAEFGGQWCGHRGVFGVYSGPGAPAMIVRRPSRCSPAAAEVAGDGRRFVMIRR
ncbi:protein of unknown function [Thauera humireducens]|nr:protein of unknown function [Thauera humireducens]